MLKGEVSYVVYNYRQPPYSLLKRKPSLMRSGALREGSMELS
jgi:hypothetical protein